MSRRFLDAPGPMTVKCIIRDRLLRFTSMNNASNEAARIMEEIAEYYEFTGKPREPRTPTRGRKIAP